jgi:hypothetical protein
LFQLDWTRRRWVRSPLRGSRTQRAVLLKIFLMTSAVDRRLTALSTYTARQTGVATETSKSVIRDANITPTDEATPIARTFAADCRGI